MRTVVRITAVTLAASAGLAHAQSFNEGFEGGAIPATWTAINHSNPIGTQGWQVNNTGTIPGGNANLSPAHGGTFAAYVNYASTAGTGTISNWLLTPQSTSIGNGDTFSFWTRTRNPATYPDRLQVRLSAAGASANVGTTETDVGDFTTLLLDINPGYVTTGYPTAYTLESVVISGLGAPVSGRFAFRYFVENGGPTGTNSEMVGVDDVQFAQAAATGACCKPDATCQAAQTLAQCTAASGVWVNGTTCANAACAPGGSCCKADATCSFLTEAACIAASGFWGGANTTCGTCLGACCNNDGTCTAGQTASACASAGGVYKGNGSACAQANCVQPGAACLDTTLTGATFLQPGAILFFDATVANALQVKNLKVYVGEDAGTVFGVTVYTVAGGNWAAHWTAAADWTLAGTGVGVANGGANTASNVTLVSPITLAPGTYAVAIATDTRATQIYLSNGATGSFSDANLTLDLGGVSGGFAVGLQPRIWNGSLCYSLGTGGGACYANCDNSTSLPFLNVLDFTCFLQKFAAGQTYANCDNSTTAPALNVLDFTCFLQKFAAGCSAP